MIWLLLILIASVMDADAEYVNQLEAEVARLSAELAQVRDLRAAAEQERDSLIEGNAWLDRELREVREERDAARENLANWTTAPGNTE